MKYAKFAGALHLEGRTQSLIKSSEKELSGFLSAFLRARHKPTEKDPAVLARQQDGAEERSGTLGGKRE